MTSIVSKTLTSDEPFGTYLRRCVADLVSDPMPTAEEPRGHVFAYQGVRQVVAPVA